MQITASERDVIKRRIVAQENSIFTVDSIKAKEITAAIGKFIATDKILLGGGEHRIQKCYKALGQ